jgi:cytidylate kinase
MAIITISRQIGSLGDQIAKAAAEKLGYEYVEKSQISSVLSGLGFSLADIDKYDEKKPSIWQSLTTQKELLVCLFRAAVYELASRDNVVIVGRGGQVILRNVPGVLHVRILAPRSQRINRLMEQKKCDEKTAKRIMRQNDRDSSGYLNTYFGTNWNDSELYDLVINTRAMALNQGVELITCAVNADQIKKSPQRSENLYDLALIQKGKAALLGISKEMVWVDLAVENGIATLSGTVASPAVKNNCEKTVLKIKGIKSVDNQLTVRDLNTRIS